MKDKEQEIQSYIEKYSKLAIQHKDGLIEGNSRKTNRAYDKLAKLSNILKQDYEMAQCVIPILLKSDDIRIRMSAAEDSLELKTCVQEALKIFEDSVDDQNLDFQLRHNAVMTLKVRNDEGY